MRTDRYRSQIQGAVAEIMSLAAEDVSKDPVTAMSEILEGFVSQVVADDTHLENLDRASEEPEEQPQPDPAPTETPEARGAASMLSISTAHHLD